MFTVARNASFWDMKSKIKKRLGVTKQNQILIVAGTIVTAGMLESIVHRCSGTSDAVKHASLIIATRIANVQIGSGTNVVPGAVAAPVCA